MIIHIMTFNIQHGLRHDRKPENIIDLQAVASFINEQNVDFVGLNEVRGAGDRPGYTNQVETVAGFLPGFTPYFGEAFRHNQKQELVPYGNALLTRDRILDVRTIPIPDPDSHRYAGYYETRCIIRATIEREGKKFIILVTHFGLNPDEWENAERTVMSLVEETELPIVLMGDFNMIPETSVITRLREVFTDTTPYMKGNTLTFPSDQPTIKIDYVFTRGFTVREAKVIQQVVSDHYPIVATLELP